MRFAGAGRAEEVDDFTAIDELELGKGENRAGWRQASA